MNMKVKTTIVIILTLILGIILGAMLNRIFVIHRIRRAFDSVNPDRFTMMLEQVIEPTAEQKKQIREILKKHVKIVAELRKNLDEGMASSFQTLQKELDAFLKIKSVDIFSNRMKTTRHERSGQAGVCWKGSRLPGATGREWV